jgi:hypothetical protein
MKKISLIHLRVKFLKSRLVRQDLRCRDHANGTRFFCFILLIFSFLSAGCESLRFAPGEKQKQNAWLHNRTTLAVVETAKAEDTSEKLKELTNLSELQSRAFVSYYGLPKEFPKAATAEDTLEQSNWQLANSALAESAERPDAWQVADSALELGIGVCALLGGVYGTRAVRFLKDTRAKSEALKEIVTGNELFKKQNATSAAAFKSAHANQSPQTRQIVTQLKT